jgi:hypothetical protein
MSAATVNPSWLSSEAECLARLRLYKEAAEEGVEAWNAIVPVTVDDRTADLGKFPRDRSRVEASLRGDLTFRGDKP